VALGLGGYEAPNPPDRCAPWFDRARAEGLHSIPHAGETGGPESVWSAIRLLGAERIGHGVRSIEDPALVEYLREHAIPLEVCPTSNIRLGLFPSIDQHPLRFLHDSGVPVTVNSDDPPLFNTTLNNEVSLLAEPFGFDVPTVDEILLNGVRHSFLPPDRKAALLTSYRAELDALKAVHLQ
jgi:adenosine deaminase